MRNTIARRTTCQQIDDIDALLSEIQRRRLILTYGKSGRVIPWPGSKIPLRIRSGISLHNAELKRLIALSDPRVCSNPDLHSWSWDYKVCRECCDVCAHLKPFIENQKGSAA